MSEFTPRHLVLGSSEANFVDAGADGFSRWSCVDESVFGAVHTGFGLCRLEPGASVPGHLHSYEVSVFVIEGSLVADAPEGSFRLDPSDYAMFPIAVPHALRNVGSEAAVWAEMTAPQARRRHDFDTYPMDELLQGEPFPVDVRDPRTRSFGHINPENMDADLQTQDRLAVSASMRTALLVYSGITVKMMVDSDLGAQLHTMFMVQYQPGGFAGAHDHPFEEAYLILDGEVDAVFDGEEYHMVRGDVAFAGVGAVHQFSNPGPGIVRWLETQAPQPPGRHSYRFARDWSYLEEVLGSG